MILKISISLSLFALIQCICPPTDIIFPCECEEFETGSNLYRFRKSFRCGGNQLFNLTEIFHKISLYYKVSDVKEKIFYQLAINNTAIVELEENTLKDIFFRKIILGRYHNQKMKLERIHEKAFSSSTNLLEYLELFVSYRIILT